MKTLCICAYVYIQLNFHRASNRWVDIICWRINVSICICIHRDRERDSYVSLCNLFHVWLQDPKTKWTISSIWVWFFNTLPLLTLAALHLLPSHSKSCNRCREILMHRNASIANVLCINQEYLWPFEKRGVTLPETNIGPEDWWLGDYRSFPVAACPIFRDELLVLGRVPKIIFECVKSLRSISNCLCISFFQDRSWLNQFWGVVTCPLILFFLGLGFEIDLFHGRDSDSYDPWGNTHTT